MSDADHYLRHLPPTSKNKSIVRKADMIRKVRPYQSDDSDDESLGGSLEDQSPVDAITWVSESRASQRLEAMVDEMHSASNSREEGVDRNDEETVSSSVGLPLDSSLVTHLHKIDEDNSNVQWPMDVEDYLPVFPHTFDRLFQQRIAAKREFAMLHSERGEKIPDGDLYSQQKFVRLFLSHYDRLFLISEPGTGKTCSVVAFCEMLARMKKNNIKHSLSKIQKFYILVRSPFHVQNIKSMIDGPCSGGWYRKESVMRSGRPDRKRKRRGMRRYMTKSDLADRERRSAYKLITVTGYEVVTYITFAKMIRDEFLNSSHINMHALKSKFMNTVVWVDEAHNIALNQSQLITKKSTVKEDTYWTLHKLFHSVERMKVVLSTATPMLNHAGEIMSLVNLLRPEDKFPPSNWNWRATDDSTFQFRFNTKSNHLNRTTSPASSVVPCFVGQMNPKVVR